MLLDKNKILQNIKSSDIQLLVEQSVDSTNTYLKNFASATSISVCTAEQQTHGRGRHNRPWQSPFGENIYCSFKFEFTGTMTKLSGLSIALSVALHKLLNKLLKQNDLKIKWPNDLLFAGKKLAGILVEIEKSSANKVFVIMGIGINVNMLNDSEKTITQAWTSLREIIQQPLDRNLILAELIDAVSLTWKQYLQTGLQPYQAYYHKHDFFKNKRIKIKHNNSILEGMAVGINDLGFLQLDLTDGRRASLHSGEASVLKPIV